jgi:GTPase SAR1 family protein
MIKNPETRLLALLNKHIPQNGEMQAGGDLIKTLYTNIQNPELVIPVLGLQGVGKSTLLNSILQENIMPNEADETTCIPVEVRYGVDPALTIHFLNGKKAAAAAEDIAQYVDNNYNPGNEKQVSHIVIFRDLELLKKGIVLVDLPGVGSMTANNQKTTTDYIKKLYAAIFVIRINPPITRTESVFIKMAWGGLSNAWFVQNRWNDESDREVAEGLDWNKTVLNDIANVTKTPYSGEIITVNAYKALSGILQNDSGKKDSSNISAITGVLEKIDSEWKDLAEKSYIKKVNGIIDLVKSTIQDKMEKCRLSKEELEEKLRAGEAAFQKTSIKIDEEIKGINTLLAEQKVKVSSSIAALTAKAEENIRANVYRVIDGGVTDGEDLTKTFTDYQMQEFSIVQNGYNDIIRDKMTKLCDKMHELSEILQREQKKSFEAASFARQKELKWEKGMNIAITLGGSIVGFKVGAAIGAAIGTAIVPPFGTIIGVVAGVAIAAFVSFIGGQSKKMVTQKRASETKRQIAPYIKDVCENMQKKLIEAFNYMCVDISDKLEEFRNDRIENARKIKEESEAILKNDDTDALIRELTDDLEILSQEAAVYHV